jgi:Zn-dependent metalloprotease
MAAVRWCRAGFIVVSMVAVALASASVGLASSPYAEAVRCLEDAAGDEASVALHRATGAVRFVRLPPGGIGLAGASEIERADDFLAHHGAAFGLRTPAAQLSAPREQLGPYGGRRLSYRQIERGVPVWGAWLRLHFDAAGDLVAANGTVVPVPANLGMVPRLAAADATQRALASASVARDRLTTGVPELMVFRTGLVQGVQGIAHLAWRVPLTDERAFGEDVFVDAHTGKVLDRIATVTDGLSRRAFDTEAGYPASPFWSEGDAFPTGNAEADRVIAFTEDAHQLFWTAFGFDSYDGAGAVMDAVFDRTFDCPNASWNGTYTSYCNGLSGDGIVGHEWTHAYTRSTHDLIYQWQPGALNEAYSDIFGEVVDRLNGEGTDTPDITRSAGGCSTYGGSPPPVLEVSAPAAVAGVYLAAGASFNPQGPVTASGPVVTVSDGVGTPSDACEALVGFPAGSLALVYRGSCNFAVKTANAQAAGAVGVIMVNNQGDDVFSVSGDGAGISIPTVFIGQTDGALLQSASGVQASLTIPASVDGSVRWLVGEDSPGFGGAIRDLWSPNCFGLPGKVSDADWYHCSEEDHGGVHTNMGVPSHAFALLVDGGTFNGRTVPAIGLTKAAHLYWRAMSVYQGPTSDFADHADALEASCADLVGVNLADLVTGGPSGQIITTADCSAVSTAVAAVELRTEPTSCAFEPLLDPEPPMVQCSEIQFTETFESDPGSRWTLSNDGVFAEYDPRDWLWTGDLPDGRPGAGMYGVNSVDIGDCTPGNDDQSGVMHLDSLAIQIGADSVLSFDHWVATEADWDGANVKISINGGAHQVVPPGAYLFNPPNGAILASGNTNPLAGEPAFTGTDGGRLGGSWGRSVVDLSALADAGDTVTLRFDLGVDGCNGVEGWYVDDVSVCTASLPGVIRASGASSAHTIDDASTLSWDHHSSGSDRLLLAGVTVRSNRAVIDITYAGQSLTRIREYHPGIDVRTELWYLLAPPTGTHAVVVTTESATTIEAGAITWNGVGQTAETALGADACAGGTGTTASLTVAGAPGEVVVDTIGTQAFYATVTADGSQLERWNRPGSWGVGAASSKPGEAQTTMSWTLAYNENWAQCAVALRPSAVIFADGFEDGTTNAW